VSMLTCDGWDKAPFYAEVINNASMENTGPVSVTIHDYTVTLSAYMCEDKDGSMQGGSWCNDNSVHAKETVIGNFTAPGNNLQKGSNIVTNSVRFNVNNATEANGGFIIPLFLTGHSQILVFSAPSVDVSVLGWKVKGLSLNKRMMCTYLGVDGVPNPQVSKPYCPKDSTEDITPVAMNCIMTTEVYKTKPRVNEDDQVKVDASAVLASSETLLVN
jgi:hypothetical protein